MLPSSEEPAIREIPAWQRAKPLLGGKAPGFSRGVTYSHGPPRSGSPLDPHPPAFRASSCFALAASSRGLPERRSSSRMREMSLQDDPQAMVRTLRRAGAEAHAQRRLGFFESAGP